MHSWSDVSLRSTIQSICQEQFSVNVWTDTVGDGFVSPYILPHRLSGSVYLHF
jgi:hypothetical protein